MKAFVIMPFDNKIADAVFEHSTKKICEEFDLDAERADEIITPNPIIDDIINALEEASVIIADISGKNPNVFYELGMSHILKQNQTLIITQEEYEQVPFDVQHFRIIRYENTIAGKVEYEKQLRKMLKNILRDYKSIYKNEFEILLDFLINTNSESDLHSLLALAKSPNPLKTDNKFEYAGHNERTGNKQEHISMSTGNCFAKFLQLDYVKIQGELISLTDKGKAFVEILEEKGFVIDMVNDHILTEGFVPMHKRITKSGKK